MAGVHSEGGVWATLWGLLMWDALFADVADSLRTPFQTCPLDLSSPTFYTVRPPGCRTKHIHECMHSLLLLIVPCKGGASRRFAGAFVLRYMNHSDHTCIFLGQIPSAPHGVGRMLEV